MLQTILEAVRLDARRCAGLLGVSPRIFGEWVTAQRPIPASYLQLLSDILGVQPSVFQMSTKQARTRNVQDYTPAIWFKFRGEGLVDADRECVLLIRQLGHFQNRLEEVTGKRSVGWRPMFEGIRREVNGQASPTEQGRVAARMLRESTGLSQCATGIGEVFRGNLRRLGILVIESPIAESQIEGCSFYVGTHPSERPCVFANTHHLTWFRRNFVLMHEVGHAIFDSPSSAASLDFVGTGDGSEICEQRAQAFAQEALVPDGVLRHVAQSHGIRWDSLSARDLALLIAETQIEQRVVARVAIGAGLIDADQEERVLALDVWPYLKEISDRALSTREYLKKVGEASKEKLLLGKRTTTIPARPIRLPVSYILSVIEALKEMKINKGKAAEFLMIDEYDLDSRFEDQVATLERD